MSAVAIVTGAASGMGLATARILGGDHRVALADLSEERLDAAVRELAGLGVEAQGLVCDIGSRESVDALFGAAGEMGDIRAVVHAAGLSPHMAPAEQIVHVNAVGTAYIGEASLRVANEGFALVNVASFAAHTGPGFLNPKRTFRLVDTDADRMGEKLTSIVHRLPSGAQPGLAYTFSKSFVVWYSAHMAAPFGAKGARVLSVSPGSIDTPMGRLEEKGGAGKLTEHAALKRFGSPEEVAEVLAFCAGDRPGYLTGVDILCDGGTKAGMGLRDLVDLARGAD